MKLSIKGWYIYDIHFEEGGRWGEGGWGKNEMLSDVGGRVGGSERSGCPIFIFLLKKIRKLYLRHDQTSFWVKH